MENRSSSFPKEAAALTFILIGAAAGAAITWALSETGREKLTSLSLTRVVPQEFLKTMADSLQSAKNRAIEAVDSASNSFGR
jgi:hypothetical protein